MGESQRIAVIQGLGVLVTRITLPPVAQDAGRALRGYEARIAIFWGGRETSPELPAGSPPYPQFLRGLHLDQALLPGGVGVHDGTDVEPQDGIGAAAAPDDFVWAEVFGSWKVLAGRSKEFPICAFAPT